MKTKRVKSNYVGSDGNSDVYVRTINSTLLEHPRMAANGKTGGKLIFCLFVLRFFSEARLKLRNSCADDTTEQRGLNRVCLIKATYTCVKATKNKV